MEDNAQSAVETPRRGNSYPVVSRWSQNEERFLKSGLAERCEIGIVRVSDRKKIFAERVIRGVGVRDMIVLIVKAGYAPVPAIRVR